jgi:glutamyl/glutaminyl-tRNA synthetase
MSLRTRIAPTPSGYLHPGNGVSFILTWALARAAGGTVLLRIDDLDRARFRLEYLDDIFYTLDWLGLDYDEGPASPQDFLDRFSQSHRLDTYHKALDYLKKQNLLYACDCSRKRIRTHSESGVYDGFCSNRNLDLATPDTAWRIRLPAGCTVQFQERGRVELFVVNRSGMMGDFVVRQKDGIPAYQIASLCDDAAWGINFIVRGMDLLPSTAAQLWLSQYLPEAAGFQHTAFYHHPLLTGPAGDKLSKSAGAASLAAWRDAGRSPRELYQQAGEWLGLEGVGTSEELVAAAGG